MKNGTLQIGQLSKKSGFSIPTIRFYEEQGLLERASRSNGGFRLYTSRAVDKLLFIKKAQMLGFTLKEIKTMLRESKKGLKNCCGFVEGLIKQRLRVLNNQIDELKTMRSGLEDLLKCWIPPREAKKKKYAVCPQIEVERKS